MKNNRLTVKFILALVAAGIFIFKGESSTFRKNPAAGNPVDVAMIESNIHKMKKKLESLRQKEPEHILNVNRDPFTPPFREPAVKKTDNGSILKPVEIKAPQLLLTGIIWAEKPLAIIGQEVRAEGEYVGQYQVYRIEKERIIIKYEGSLFPYEINNRSAE